MQRITESSKLAIRGSWAAWNHALAVELEKREVRLLPRLNDHAGWPPWFSPEFDSKIIDVLLDHQVEIKKSIDDVFSLPWVGCHFAAWRYLHDVVDGGLPVGADSALESRQARMLDAIQDKWLMLVSHWNAQHKNQKEELNRHYKILLDKIIVNDFSSYGISEEEQAGLSELNVQVCDAVIDILRKHLGKLRPVHLHAMLRKLERVGLAPKGNRAACAVFLGGRYGVRVRKDYRPDPSRHRFAEYDGDEARSEGAKAEEATSEALVKLKLIPLDYAFRMRR
jgi:hypothetical protein